jgi:hypothetical protein
MYVVRKHDTVASRVQGRQKVDSSVALILDLI